MRIVVALLLLAGLALPGTLRAETVKELNRRMSRAFTRKDYRGVVRLALELYQRTKTPQLLANIGRAYDLLREDASALRYYQRFLREERRPTLRGTVLKRIVVVRARLSVLRREVTLVSNPSGAEVSIDGRHRPGWVTPFVLWLPFKRTHFSFRKEGFEPFSRTLEVTAGPPMTLDQQLSAIQRSGVLVVSGRVEHCVVTLDGKRYGVAPLRIDKLRPGRYRLALQRPGYPLWLGSVTIVAGQTQTLTLDYPKLARLPLPEKPRRVDPYRVSAWVGIGVGLALLVAGTGLQIAAKRADDDANRYLDEQQKLAGELPVSLDVEREYNRRYDRGQLRRRWAIGLFAAGGVVTVAGIVLFFIKPKRRRESLSFRVVPQLSPSQLGVVTRMEFE